LFLGQRFSLGIDIVKMGIRRIGYGIHETALHPVLVSDARHGSREVRIISRHQETVLIEVFGLGAFGISGLEQGKRVAGYGVVVIDCLGIDEPSSLDPADHRSHRASVRERPMNVQPASAILL
jgi:hypothetical protein